jgi:hypothetical protein
VDLINVICDKICFEKTYPEFKKSFEDTVLEYRKLTNKKKSKKTFEMRLFYLGQKVMIRSKNFSKGKDGIFNGEIYSVEEIFSSDDSEEELEYIKSSATKRIRNVDANHAKSKAINRIRKYDAFLISGDSVKGIGFCKSYQDSDRFEESRIFIKLKRYVSSSDGYNDEKTSSSKISTKIACLDCIKISPKIRPPSKDDNVPVFNLGVDNIGSAWAITVNKSQGSEYPNACFCVIAEDEQEHFSKGHGLVAISRSKRAFCYIGRGLEGLCSLSLMDDMNEDSENSKRYNLDFVISECFIDKTIT